ncbi:MAG: type II toxin-antitoxin system Phd/YefM family antitoxin [Deltaproteobacteria bacterium]|nr:type II toxin-antitoxin system Phd/YefM family antitoxin [Deltaproteobacteria bacterium]
MKASIVDLRYKMNDVLKALDRNENVEILYHGKVKGIIVAKMSKSEKSIRDHAYFGMSKHDTVPIDEDIEDLRKPRI